MSHMKTHPLVVEVWDSMPPSSGKGGESTRKGKTKGAVQVNVLFHMAHGMC